MRTDYTPLRRHLSGLEGQEWSTSFPELERILRDGLPDSARKHRPWWANHAGNTQGRVWLDAGWKVERVNLRAETVVFRRTRSMARGRNTPPIQPSKAIVQSSSKNGKTSLARAGRPPVIPAKAGIQKVGAARQPVLSAYKGIANGSRLPLDIDSLMEGLSRSRPIFHLESDFQDALAEHIRKTIPGSLVRREHTFRYRDSKMRLDIWLPKERIAIELKYPTRMLELEWGDEEYLLADHGAQPLRRYDFLKDVQRLERVVAEKNARGGFAILLTNHSYYWESPKRRWRTAIDAAFRLHEGRKVAGELNWSERAGAGTTRGREDPIDIIGSYDLHWRDYSRLGGRSSQRFRYLALSIGNERYPNPALRLGSPRPRESFFQRLAKSLGLD